MDCPLFDPGNRRVAKLTVEKRESCFAMLLSSLEENVRVAPCSSGQSPSQSELRDICLRMEHGILQQAKSNVGYTGSVSGRVGAIKICSKAGRTFDLDKWWTPKDVNEKDPEVEEKVVASERIGSEDGKVVTVSTLPPPGYSHPKSAPYGHNDRPCSGIGWEMADDSDDGGLGSPVASTDTTSGSHGAASGRVTPTDSTATDHKSINSSVSNSNDVVSTSADLTSSNFPCDPSNDAQNNDVPTAKGGVGLMEESDVDDEEDVDDFIDVPPFMATPTPPPPSEDAGAEEVSHLSAVAADTEEDNLFSKMLVSRDFVGTSTADGSSTNDRTGTPVDDPAPSTNSTKPLAKQPLAPANIIISAGIAPGDTQQQEGMCNGNLDVSAPTSDEDGDVRRTIELDQLVKSTDSRDNGQVTSADSKERHSKRHHHKKSKKKRRGSGDNGDKQKIKSILKSDPSASSVAEQKSILRSKAHHVKEEIVDDMLTLSHNAEHTSTSHHPPSDPEDPSGDIVPNCQVDDDDIDFPRPPPAKLPKIRLSELAADEEIEKKPPRIKHTVRGKLKGPSANLSPGVAPSASGDARPQEGPSVDLESEVDRYFVNRPLIFPAISKLPPDIAAENNDGVSTSTADDATSKALADGDAAASYFGPGALGMKSVAEERRRRRREKRKERHDEEGDKHSSKHPGSEDNGVDDRHRSHRHGSTNGASLSPRKRDHSDSNTASVANASSKNSLPVVKKEEKPEKKKRVVLNIEEYMKVAEAKRRKSEEESATGCRPRKLTVVGEQSYDFEKRRLTRVRPPDGGSGSPASGLLAVNTKPPRKDVPSSTGASNHIKNKHGGANHHSLSAKQHGARQKDDDGNMVEYLPWQCHLFPLQCLWRPFYACCELDEAAAVLPAPTKFLATVGVSNLSIYAQFSELISFFDSVSGFL